MTDLIDRLNLRLCVDVVEQRIDSQVAPHRVLFRCAEAHHRNTGVLGISFYGMIYSMIYSVIYVMMCGMTNCII